MNILLVCFVIGAIVSIILWSMEDSKGESGLGGDIVCWHYRRNRMPVLCYSDFIADWPNIVFIQLN